MATPMEHYRQAELLIARAEEWSKHMNDDAVDRVLRTAQIHATLAAVSDAQYRPPSRSN